jgi:hypothetical protein
VLICVLPLDTWWDQYETNYTSFFFVLTAIIIHNDLFVSHVNIVHVCGLQVPVERMQWMKSLRLVSTTLAYRGIDRQLFQSPDPGKHLIISMRVHYNGADLIENSWKLMRGYVLIQPYWETCVALEHLSVYLASRQLRVTLLNLQCESWVNNMPQLVDINVYLLNYFPSFRLAFNFPWFIHFCHVSTICDVIVKISPIITAIWWLRWLGRQEWW